MNLLAQHNVSFVASDVSAHTTPRACACISGREAPWTARRGTWRAGRKNWRSTSARRWPKARRFARRWSTARSRNLRTNTGWSTSRLRRPLSPTPRQPTRRGTSTRTGWKRDSRRCLETKPTRTRGWTLWTKTARPAGLTNDARKPSLRGDNCRMSSPRRGRISRLRAI